MFNNSLEKSHSGMKEQMKEHFLLKHGFSSMTGNKVAIGAVKDPDISKAEIRNTTEMSSWILHRNYEPVDNICL